jgi:hypothetical protein
MARVYGSVLEEGRAPSTRKTNRFDRRHLIGAAGLAVFAAMALLAANPPSRHTELMSRFNKHNVNNFETFGGQNVKLPIASVDYAAGTTVHPEGEFHYDAHDARAARTMALFQRRSKVQTVVPFSDRPMTVPAVQYNYAAGTTVHPYDQWQDSAMDARRARTQALFQRRSKVQTVVPFSDRPMTVPAVQYNYAAGTTVHPYDQWQDSAMDARREIAQNREQKLAQVVQTQQFSGKHARSDVQAYFARQAKLAAAPQKPAQKPAASNKVTEKAPKHGVTAAQANESMDKYFARQAKLAAAPRARPARDLTGKQARASDEKYFNEQAKKMKSQKLSITGVGTEEAVEAEVPKAAGVDAMMPESVFESNPPVDQAITDEVNQAIEQQRMDGYTNGDGQDAEDVLPSP